MLPAIRTIRSLDGEGDKHTRICSLSVLFTIFCTSSPPLILITINIIIGYASMNAEDTVRLQAHMYLAKQLGAEIVTTHGEDVPTQIAEYARLSDVTKIVIGRSGIQRRHFWSEPALTERLITLAPEVDIHIIPDAEVYKSYRGKRLSTIRPVLPTARELLLTLGILAAATIIGWLFLKLDLASANIIMVYLLGVLLTSSFSSFISSCITGIGISSCFGKGFIILSITF